MKKIEERMEQEVETKEDKIAKVRPGLFGQVAMAAVASRMRD
jgi:hypothetical protein